MKTRTTTLFTTLFALTLSVSAFADDHGHQMYVLPGAGTPAVSPPRLDFHGFYLLGQGMYVEHVVWGGKAHQLGIENGDMIVAINGQTITCQHHYFELLQEAVMYHGGHAQLLIRNVRGFPAYVNVNAYFPCGAPPVLYQLQQ